MFGPTTTTRHVYDIAAQHVVNGAMEGVNGIISLLPHFLFPIVFQMYMLVHIVLKSFIRV